MVGLVLHMDCACIVCFRVSCACLAPVVRCLAPRCPRACLALSRACLAPSRACLALSCTVLHCLAAGRAGRPAGRLAGWPAGRPAGGPAGRPSVRPSVRRLRWGVLRLGLREHRHPDGRDPRAGGPAPCPGPPVRPGPCPGGRTGGGFWCAGGFAAGAPGPHWLRIRLRGMRSPGCGSVRVFWCFRQCEEECSGVSPRSSLSLSPLLLPPCVPPLCGLGWAVGDPKP